MIKFWSICQNTFVQTIRQPIFSIVILVTFGVLVLELALAGWTMNTSGNYNESDQKMLESLGLSTLLISGMFIAALSASNVLTREIEDKTALTVISKPVSRATFVTGKFAGVAAAITCAFYLCALGFLLTIRHRVMSTAATPYDVPVITLGLSALGLTILTAMLGNLIFGWNVNSTGVWSGMLYFSIAMGLLTFIGKGWTIVPLGYDKPLTGHDDMQVLHAQLLIGVGLMWMAVMILTAVAVAASTRLGQLLTLLVCLGVFFLGSMHPKFQSLAIDYPIFHAATWLLPNLTYFYALDALSMGKDIPLSMVGLFGVYGLMYVAAMMAVGMTLFQTRQLESQATSSAMPGLVGLLGWVGRAVSLGVAIWVITDLSVAFHKGAQAGDLVRAGVGLAAAGVNWLVWGYFVRGVKWSYRLVLGVSVLAVLATGAGLLIPAAARKLAVQPGQMLLPAVAAALVLLILVVPKTRHHFKKA